MKRTTARRATLLEPEVKPARSTLPRHAPPGRGDRITILQGDLEGGERCYSEALELFREVGDERNAVALLSRFAVHAGNRGDVDEARRLVAEVRALNESVGHPAVEPQMLSTLAMVAYWEGDLETAVGLSRHSSEAAGACGWELWELWQLAWQVELAVKLDRLGDARNHQVSCALLRHAWEISASC